MIDFIENIKIPLILLTLFILIGLFIIFADFGEEEEDILEEEK